jgi:predicted MFS family arabinose efflux permease
MDITGIVAIISVFSTIIVVAYLFFSSRHKIRMALIQHGQDASIFKEDKDANSALKFGMVAVGVGLGLFAGGLLDSIGMEEGPAYFGMMLIFGGASLILYYLIVKKKFITDETV